MDVHFSIARQASPATNDAPLFGALRHVAIIFERVF
jgi:hypothetical protein